MAVDRPTFRPAGKKVEVRPEIKRNPPEVVIIRRPTYPPDPEDEKVKL
jgi:hypothetical protein